MIKKLSNGNTLITLGEGTVFTGNVHAHGDDKPFGIYYSNINGKSDDAVIIGLTSNKAIASYVMSLVRFMEAWKDDDDSDLSKTIKSLKADLEPYLPKVKSNSN